MSAAACPHYCTDPDVTRGSGRGCPLVVHYWADLQSVHGLRCYGNITRTRNVSASSQPKWHLDRFSRFCSLCRAHDRDRQTDPQTSRQTTLLRLHNEPHLRTVSVCLFAAAFPHYCTDPDVTRGNGRGCPLVVHYWADLQSVHGLRCYGNVALSRRCIIVLDDAMLMTSLPVMPHNNNER